MSVHVRRALMSRVFSQSHLDEGMQYTLSRLVSYTLIAIGLIIGLQMIGFDLSALAVFGGLFGIGLGFGLQNIFSNFVSGLILLIERPIKIGDKLSLGNISGTVMEIGLRVWVPSPQFRAEVANKLRFAIRRAFQQAGIEIPFPQRDVRLVSEIPM